MDDGGLSGLKIKRGMNERMDEWMGELMK